MIKTFLRLAGLLITSALSVSAMAEQDDPFLWLEEVQGEKALGYVEGLNAASLPHLESMAGFAEDEAAILQQLNAPDRIAYGVFRGGYMYNFWQDETNVRGIIRRSPQEAYLSGEPEWETVLDIDVLSKEEDANWVYRGSTCLGPQERLCLLSLSPGGTDAVEVREFDLEAKAFVEGGFVIPTAKSRFDWVDEDHLMVGTDFGPNSGNGWDTTSGYPRTQRLWKRGTPLSEAKEILSIPNTSVLLAAVSEHTAQASRTYIQAAQTFWTADFYVHRPGTEPLKLPLPHDAKVVEYSVDTVFALMRTDWVIGDLTLPAGALVSLDVSDALAGGDGSPQIVFMPSQTQAISGVSVAGGAVYVSLLDNVSGSLLRLTRGEDATWSADVLDLPDNGAVSVVSAHPQSDEILINFESFLQPETLYHAKEGRIHMVQSMPERFDPEDFRTEQHFATSEDGTDVPYYVVKSRKARRGKPIPTWAYAYGGFEVPITPAYLSAKYQRWIEGGGAAVFANIRGGGEYGPAWHQAALLKNRHKAFEDMAAVLDDLVDRRQTTPQMLGVAGGSNGGLLTGVMLTRYPGKHNAAIVGVPLIDMLRYHKLLAGASWVGEYGDPDDPDMRGYIESYSPYQNISGDVAYPEAFIFTSTKDDRVHPGHARKFAARLAKAKQPFLFYENIEGGHAGAANRAQSAYRGALELAFMKRRLFPQED